MSCTIRIPRGSGMPAPFAAAESAPTRTLQNHKEVAMALDRETHTCMGIMILVPVLILCFAAQASADWLPETRLTTAADISYLSDNNARCLVTDQSGVMHLVWYDFRDGDAEIYYRNFDGAAWGAETALTNNSAQSLDPAIALDTSDDLHLVWVDYVTLSPEIYHKSFDGISWTAAVAVTDGCVACENPSIAADGLGRLHVVWREYRDSSWGIFYSMFDGLTWSEALRITDPAAYARHASVSCDDSQHVHVAWDDYRDLNWEIYYLRFDGVVWGAEVRLTSDAGLSAHPTLVTDSNEIIHVFWDDDRNGHFDIYQKTFDGLGWSTDQMIADGFTDALAPSAVAGDSGALHLVWYDDPGSSIEIYHMEFGGVSWGTPERISEASGDSKNPTVALDAAGSPHIVWHDRRHGNFEIYWRARSTLPWPEITSIEPDHAMAFTDVHISDLAGIKFFDPVKVWLQRAGEQDVQATNEVVESATRITCDFDLRYISAGDWHVVVENPDEKRDTLVPGFTVQPLPWPQLYSIDPDSGLAFTVAYRTITGINLTEGAAIWLEMEGEASIEATNITVTSPSEIACRFDLWDVHTGYWDLVIQNPDTRGDTLVAGFRVIPQPPLAMNSIEPSVATAYERVHISDLSGSEFDPDASVWLEMEGENNARAKDLVIESPTKITCDFSLTAKAPGYWDVVVQNPDGRRGVLPGGFEVLPSLWNDDVRLAHDAVDLGLSPPGSRCVAVDALGHVHVVWSDYRDGNREIYYTKFDGSSWSPGLRLTDTESRSEYPALAVGGDNHLHVVWEDRRDGDYEIYYKKFDGSSWGADQRLTDAAGDSRYPSIAVYGNSGLYVAWQDKRGGTGTQYIYFRQHDGTDWLPEQPPTPTGPGASTPAISVDSSENAHVVWYRNYADDQQICYHRYDGVSWGEFEILADAVAGVAYGPTIATGDDDQLHVAWHHKESQYVYDIFYRRFNGFAWAPAERVTDDPEVSINVSIGVDAGGNVHLAWSDARDGNKEIYYARREWITASWGPRLRLTEYVRESNYPSLAVAPDGAVSVVWRDLRDGNSKIFYKMRKSDALAVIDDPVSKEHPFGQLRVVPNPVRGSARIQFSLALRAEPGLSVYDVSGRLVKRIEAGLMGPGPQSIAWNGKSAAGKPVAQGIYFVEVSARGHAASTKIIVLW